MFVLTFLQLFLFHLTCKSPRADKQLSAGFSLNTLKGKGTSSGYYLAGDIRVKANSRHAKSQGGKSGERVTLGNELQSTLPHDGGGV